MAVTLAHSAAAGPPPADPWWRSPSIRSAIALTPDQVARLDEVYRESLPARRQLRKQLDDQHDRLEHALADGRWDDTQGRLLIEQVFEAEKQRNIARTLMLVRMYRVLTSDQRVRLANLGVQPFAPALP